MNIFIIFYNLLILYQNKTAQWSGTMEYADCISAEEKDPFQQVSRISFNISRFLISIILFLIL